MRALPSFDLVVATLRRVSELERLLDSLERQTHERFRVLVVDQNADDRVVRALVGTGLDVERVTSPPGLARARNVALEHLRSDLVAFPDDDCTYPPDLLATVASRFANDETLDGLSVRVADASGDSDAGWGDVPARLTKENVWNLVASAGLFLRSSLVDRVGRFDERIGIGSEEPWSSGEETDYVIRALRSGARIEYDPLLVVEHELRSADAARSRAQGYREGASVGYLLRKHGYSARTLARMLVRPVGGSALALARRDRALARFHAATLEGRFRGYLGARRSKISA
jgi:glycosyltransferase involved in cell wall biosynthesis